ncbi:MAG: hypothetical protein PUB22_03855 [Clostridiales bacterium]|nr:hypothetical protein [Clostridiales bacterium]
MTTAMTIEERIAALEAKVAELENTLTEKTKQVEEYQAQMENTSKQIKENAAKIEKNRENIEKNRRGLLEILTSGAANDIKNTVDNILEANTANPDPEPREKDPNAPTFFGGLAEAAADDREAEITNYINANK